MIVSRPLDGGNRGTIVLGWASVLRRRSPYGQPRNSQTQKRDRLRDLRAQYSERINLLHIASYPDMVEATIEGQTGISNALHHQTAMMFLDGGANRLLIRLSTNLRSEISLIRLSLKGMLHRMYHHPRHQRVRWMSETSRHSMGLLTGFKGYRPWMRQLLN